MIKNKTKLKKTDIKNKKNKKTKIMSVNKLAIFNALIALLLVIVIYQTLPKILNYPANTIDNDFQIQVVGITYSTQFTILAFLIVSFIYVFVKIIYTKLYKDAFGDANSVAKTRASCFNAPYIMILTEVILPTLLCFFLLLLFKTNLELVMRISILVFSFASIFAIISYMISKSFFRNLLIETSKYSANTNNSFRFGMTSKLLILTLPLFLCSFVLLLLIANTTMTIEKGNLLFKSYKQDLASSFNEISTLTDIKNVIDNLEFKSPTDFAVVLKDNGEFIYSGGKLLNKEFLSLYTLNFYDAQNGQCFEYYGQNTQVAMQRVHTLHGDYYVGVHFESYTNGIFVPFILCIALLMGFVIIFIRYIGKDISNDIVNISNGLNTILNSKNIMKAQYLPITSNDEFGDLTISYNKVQKLTKQHIQQIEDNQETIMGRERLASLGQLIGGIAHNLKTPIMSISGATEGLNDLIKEYDMSIGDPEVTNEDNHAIVQDMYTWTDKIKTYTGYMSDVITTVKGQAVTFSNEEHIDFTIEELVKRVDILMKHELKNALINMQVSINISPSTTIKGNINSLIQIINNMISNSIQAYNGKTDQNIELIFSKDDSNLIISVRDYAGGLPEEVKNKLFKEMITTKGKNGTGLGLFMSYSNIKAHFNGKITVDSELGVGTTFNIYIPF